MKFLFTILWILLALVLHPSLTAEENPTVITLEINGQKIEAHLPKDVSSIIRSPDKQPTFIQGTKGSEGVTIGRSDQFDIYSIQVFDPATLRLHGHVDPEASTTNLDTFIASELEYYKRTFDVINNEKNLPDSLSATNNDTNRYLLLSATYKNQKNSKTKLFLWRVMIIDKHVVLVQREVGGDYHGEKKTKINPKDEQEWIFLQSVTPESNQ